MLNIFGGNNKISSDKGEKEPLLGSMQENNSLLIEAAITGDAASIERLLKENKENIDIDFQGDESLRLGEKRGNRPLCSF